MHKRMLEFVKSSKKGESKKKKNLSTQGQNIDESSETASEVNEASTASVKVHPF